MKFALVVKTGGPYGQAGDILSIHKTHLLAKKALFEKTTTWVDRKRVPRTPGPHGLAIENI